MGDNGKENGNYYNGSYGWLGGVLLVKVSILCSIIPV